MTVDRHGVWLLIAACCAVAVPLAVAGELHRVAAREHVRWRESRLRLIATCADAALTGAAIGMAVAFGALTVAAIFERVSG
ncbi:MAG TPA: hypothetical protein VFR97_12540 [Capillimicrobium sp.]|nr:hypothetical protein [Capillimicrobium sp.]